MFWHFVLSEFYVHVCDNFGKNQSTEHKISIIKDLIGPNLNFLALIRFLFRTRAPSLINSLFCPRSSPAKVSLIFTFQAPNKYSQ